MFFRCQRTERVEKVAFEIQDEKVEKLVGSTRVLLFFLICHKTEIPQIDVMVLQLLAHLICTKSASVD